MSERKLTFIGVWSAIGGVSGLAAIGSLVFFGGGLAEKVQAHDIRITRIEQAGSGRSQMHQVADDQRDDDQERRIRALEILLPLMDRKLDKLLER